MKHAEAIAERLYYLGEIPTTKLAPILVGTTLKEMIQPLVQISKFAICVTVITSIKGHNLVRIRNHLYQI